MVVDLKAVSVYLVITFSIRNRIFARAVVTFPGRLLIAKKVCEVKYCGQVSFIMSVLL